MQHDQVFRFICLLLEFLTNKLITCEMQEFNASSYSATELQRSVKNWPALDAVCSIEALRGIQWCSMVANGTEQAWSSLQLKPVFVSSDVANGAFRSQRQR